MTKDDLFIRKLLHHTHPQDLGNITPHALRQSIGIVKVGQLIRASISEAMENLLNATAKFVY